MTAMDRLRCPRCGGKLESGPPLACPGCRLEVPLRERVLDLRLDRGAEPPPRPLATEDFEPARAARARGEPYKRALELTVLALGIVDADRLMQVIGEGRGAWFPLLASEPGGLLFVGNALSGTVASLAQVGWHVTVLDRSFERLWFGDYRNEDRYPGRTTPVQGGDAPRLPFAGASFEAVVREGGFPGASPTFAFGAEELARVARVEILRIGNNRLGYKRSTGRRTIYRRPGVVEWIRDAVAPKEGERTLFGWRRSLELPGFARPEAYALYPHASDFIHVVAIDAEVPSLSIGPMERKNRIKVAGHALGLFPVFTPSFLVHARREGAGHPGGSARRIERMLDALAERTGEPRSELERIVSTRGQSAVLQTRVRGTGEIGVPGSWTLYVPFLPSTVKRAHRRHEAQRRVRERFPWLPVPEPLFLGEADGVLVACERRLPGLSAPQLGTQTAKIAQLMTETADLLARLVVRPAERFTEEDFERLIAERFALVERFAGVPETVGNIRRLLAMARKALVGRTICRVFHHADLRGKHVQVREEDGKIVGLMDWSVSEDEYLPYLDLVHLVVHERKQEDLIDAATAWRIVRDRSAMHAYEVEVLETYRKAVGMDEETARTLEAIYPVLVAAMAERSWEYSRPRWLHRQFGI